MNDNKRWLVPVKSLGKIVATPQLLVAAESCHVVARQVWKRFFGGKIARRSVAEAVERDDACHREVVGGISWLGGIEDRQSHQFRASGVTHQKQAIGRVAVCRRVR